VHGQLRIPGAGRKHLARVRLAEAQAAARLLGARFYGPICNDSGVDYTTPFLRKVTAVVRESRARIVLTHSPSDYMEDHTFASRLAVTAAFSRGIPNFSSTPQREISKEDVTVYHAMPHGLRDPLRKKVRAGLYVNTASVQETKRAALALHKSQSHWLSASQGGEVHDILDEAAREVGKLSGRFAFGGGLAQTRPHRFQCARRRPPAGRSGRTLRCGRGVRTLTRD
jgi:N-acetylglucosamine malate deacetylase 1